MSFISVTGGSDGVEDSAHIVGCDSRIGDYRSTGADRLNFDRFDRDADADRCGRVSGLAGGFVDAFGNLVFFNLVFGNIPELSEQTSEVVNQDIEQRVIHEQVADIDVDHHVLLFVAIDLRQHERHIDARHDVNHFRGLVIRRQDHRAVGVTDHPDDFADIQHRQHRFVGLLFGSFCQTVAFDVSEVRIDQMGHSGMLDGEDIFTFFFRTFDVAGIQATAGFRIDTHFGDINSHILEVLQLLGCQDRLFTAGVFEFDIKRFEVDSHFPQLFDLGVRGQHGMSVCTNTVVDQLIRVVRRFVTRSECGVKDFRISQAEIFLFDRDQSVRSHIIIETEVDDTRDRLLRSRGTVQARHQLSDERIGHGFDLRIVIRRVFGNNAVKFVHLALNDDVLGVGTALDLSPGLGRTADQVQTDQLVEHRLGAAFITILIPLHGLRIAAQILKEAVVEVGRAGQDDVVVVFVRETGREGVLQQVFEDDPLRYAHTLEDVQIADTGEVDIEAVGHQHFADHLVNVLRVRTCRIEVFHGLCKHIQPSLHDRFGAGELSLARLCVAFDYAPDHPLILGRVEVLTEVRRDASDDLLVDAAVEHAALITLEFIQHTDRFLGSQFDQCENVDAAVGRIKGFVHHVQQVLHQIGEGFCHPASVFQNLLDTLDVEAGGAAI